MSISADMMDKEDAGEVYRQWGHNMQAFTLNSTLYEKWDKDRGGIPPKVPWSEQLDPRREIEDRERVTHEDVMDAFFGDRWHRG